MNQANQPSAPSTQPSLRPRRREDEGNAKDPAANEPGGLQPLDLLLSGASSIVAVYAAGASLSSDKNAQFFMWIVMAGTLFSTSLVWFWGKTKIVFADTTAYTLVALVAAFGLASLNDMVPESIYTGPLSMAGVLSWMLALGSFTVWRDQTMLFQAVPAVALFGLVGCYDTFRASVLYFFVFLVCQAILLSRTHGRVMLRQARSSGVEALEMSVMRKGPWRWMAGPEWALGSALTIVLISVISAPLLRESARGFSGLVHYVPPQSPLAGNNQTNPAIGGTKVGTGPNAALETEVLRADMPEPMYLRGFAYGRYDQGSWLPRTNTPNNADPSNTAPWDSSAAAITERREVTFRVEPLGPMPGGVPAPGEVEELLGDAANVYARNLGGSYTIRGEPPYPPLEGRSVVYTGRGQLKDVNRDISRYVPEYVQLEGIPADVMSYAMRVTKDAKTDFDRAMAIQRAIEGTAKYNLNAAATPTGQDPVSYFLFTSKEGYCDLFASSMTLMARSIGLPARYVTGFYPFSNTQDANGRYVIRQKDMHAWCEIYFKEAGWVVFDATEGAASVDGSGPGSTNGKPFWLSGWFIGFIVFTGGAGLVFLLYSGVSNYLRLRGTDSFANRGAIRAMQKLQAQVRKHYGSFERELRRVVRRPRGVGETISEYIGAAKPNLAHRADMASETGSAFASALYATPSLDAGKISELKSKVSNFRRARRRRSA